MEYGDMLHFSSVVVVTFADMTTIGFHCICIVWIVLQSPLGSNVTLFELTSSSCRRDDAYCLVRVCWRPVFLCKTGHHGKGRPRSALCRHPPAHPCRHGWCHETAVSPENRKCKHDLFIFYFFKPMSGLRLLDWWFSKMFCLLYRILSPHIDLDEYDSLKRHPSSLFVVEKHALFRLSCAMHPMMWLYVNGRSRCCCLAHRKDICLSDNLCTH